MTKFFPEGALIHTGSNKAALSSLSSLEKAMDITDTIGITQVRHSKISVRLIRTWATMVPFDFFISIFLSFDVGLLRNDQKSACSRLIFLAAQLASSNRIKPVKDWNKPVAAPMPTSPVETKAL